MLDLDVGAIPVCDGERLIGMITDRDLVLRVMAISRDPVQPRVSEAITPGLVFCFEDEDAETAADLMAEKQIRRVPVLSRSKQLVRIVSVGDQSLMTGSTDVRSDIARCLGPYTVATMGQKRRRKMARYSQGAQKTVKQAMRKRKKGTLKSGSGKKVTRRSRPSPLGCLWHGRRGRKFRLRNHKQPIPR
jgi:predicted transcriptional regulator